jgi:hypothetical protein
MRPFALVYLVDLQMENVAFGTRVRREGPARWLQVFPDMSSRHRIGAPCGRCRGTPGGNADHGRSARRANHFGFAESCQAPKSKKFLFTGILIYGINPPSPRHHEGRSRDRHATWCGLRWTLRRQVIPHRTKTPAADGEVVWSWRRDRGVKPARSIAPVTVAKTPLTGEITYKP